MSDDFARAAFLRYLQAENGCNQTSERCRRGNKCGCELEMEEYIQAERMPADLISPPRHA